MITQRDRTPAIYVNNIVYKYNYFVYHLPAGLRFDGEVVVVGVRIVAAGAGEVGELVHLNARLFREDAGTKDPVTDTSWPEKHGRGHFLALISGDDAACFLALSGGVAVGYLAGFVKEETPLRPVRVAELQSMYVSPGQRDREVGTRLVVRFLAWASGRGAERVSVSAYAANEGAVRFLPAPGFRAENRLARGHALTVAPPAAGPAPPGAEKPSGGRGALLAQGLYGRAFTAGSGRPRSSASTRRPSSTGSSTPR